MSIVLIIIGALGSVPADLSSYLENLTIPLSLILPSQRSVLLRTIPLNSKTIYERLIIFAIVVFLSSWFELGLYVPAYLCFLIVSS